MTDKQIIIDGCDVSEYIYFKMNDKIPMCRACNSGVGSPYCEYHKDCYYKQLKRKEKILSNVKQIAKSFCNAYKEFGPKKRVEFVRTVTMVKSYKKSANTR